jgi:hypothetical protein
LLTIFDILPVAVAVAGADCGYRAGHSGGGVAGGVVGAGCGVVVGWALGSLPFLLSARVLRRSLASSSIPHLRERLEREYFISHLIIAELVKRGEPVESVREAVMRQLASQNADVQRFGKTNAKLWFPDLLGGPVAR